MQLHQVIEDVRKLYSGISEVEKIDPGALPPSCKKSWDLILDWLKNSVQFNLESAEVITEEHVDFGMNLHKKGLLHLPFERVFLNAGNRYAMLFTKMRLRQGNTFAAVHFATQEHGRRPLQKHQCAVPYVVTFLSEDGTVRPGTCIPEKWLKVVTGIEEEQARTKFINQQGIEIVGAMAGFCSLIMSKNIYVNVEEAPHKLNKKRLARGKELIRGVQHITIHTDPQIIKQGNPEGNRSSPVIHWRRGHIRKLESGKLIPIAPTIVNAGDEYKPLAKTYRVK